MKFLAVLALSAVAAFGQVPVTVKKTPASDALVQAAQEAKSGQTTIDTQVQQAKSALEITQKQLTEKLVQASKDLNTELKADKKYKGKIDEIETLQKQVNKLGDDANAQLGQKLGPIQVKVNNDKALIDALIPIVSKENSLPATAVFNRDTGTWTDSTAVPAPKK